MMLELFGSLFGILGALYLFFAFGLWVCALKFDSVDALKRGRQ